MSDEQPDEAAHGAESEAVQEKRPARRKTQPPESVVPETVTSRPADSVTYRTSSDPGSNSVPASASPGGFYDNSGTVTESSSHPTYVDTGTDQHAASASPGD